MPLDRPTLERALAEVNVKLPPARPAVVTSFAPERFELAFPDLALPDGHCIDEHFVDVQFALSIREKVDTSIVGTKYDENDRRYFVTYEVIDW